MARKHARIAAAVTAAALAGAGAGGGAVALTHHGSSPAAPAAVAAPNVANTASASLSVGQIAKAATPGVVEIDATESATNSPFPQSGGSGTAEARRAEPRRLVEGRRR
jgi:hypothetical protein